MRFMDRITKRKPKVSDYPWVMLRYLVQQYYKDPNVRRDGLNESIWAVESKVQRGISRRKGETVEEITLDESYEAIRDAIDRLKGRGFIKEVGATLVPTRVYKPTDAGFEYYERYLRDWRIKAIRFVGDGVRQIAIGVVIGSIVTIVGYVLVRWAGQ